MFRVLGCIAWQHDWRLVVLAGLLCLFACFTAVSMLARAGESPGRARALWLAGAGVVAGCGIWATHFVAMLAFRSGFPVGYDAGLTLLSVVIAASLCGLGFFIALRPRLAMIGGAITGGAIGAMHYVGMSAVRAAADVSWDLNYVVASVAIGVVLTAFAMRMAAGKTSLRAHALGAVLFTLAICGMHFTAMAAFTLAPNPLVPTPEAVMAPGTLAIAVASVAVLIVAIGLMGAVLDHHLARRSSDEAARLRAHVAELEMTKHNLETTSQGLSVALDAAASASRAKSEFLAAMSHELRTPLNAVIGFSDVLLHEMFGPLGNERYRGYARDIRQSGAHLLSLINDILDLSRIDAEKLELDESEFDVAEVIDEALRIVAHQAGTSGIALSSAVEPDLPRLRADKRRVRQILLNLLSNAIKFTPAKGCVRVSARCRDSQISLAVQDTGIGIAKEDLPKALQLFGQVDSRLSRKYDGAGLGLPLAKQIAERHGGTLEIDSTQGVGTTVMVRFPAGRSVGELRQVA